MDSPYNAASHNITDSAFFQASLIHSLEFQLFLRLSPSQTLRLVAFAFRDFDGVFLAQVRRCESDIRRSEQVHQIFFLHHQPLFIRKATHSD